MDNHFSDDPWIEQIENDDKERLGQYLIHMAHVPCHDAVAYWQPQPDPVKTVRYRESADAIYIGRDYLIDEFLLGMCPVRRYYSLWLFSQGRWWTSKMWASGGSLKSTDGDTLHLSLRWPRCSQDNLTEMYNMIKESSHLWQKGSFPAMADFNGTLVGPNSDWGVKTRPLIRSLVAYDFDQEWGQGAFTASIRAAHAKHRKVSSRTHRRTVTRGFKGYNAIGAKVF